MGRKVACFTREQQDAYDRLNPRHQLYVDYRGLGYSKAESYRCAGFNGKTAKQGALQLEKTKPVIKQLIDVIQKHNMAAHAIAMEKKESDLRSSPVGDEEVTSEHRLNALAQQSDDKRTLQTIEDMDANTADRIRFYRGIINGKIKTTKETINYDASGVVKSRKVEIIDDVGQRVNARRELDRIMGIGQLTQLGNISAGQITINIVDASKSSVEREQIERQEAILVEDSDVIMKDDGGENGE